MKKANDRQVSGTHYKKMFIEHWDLAALYGWDYFQARAIAYVMRWRDKGGIADLEKSIHFLQKYIEVEKAKADGTLTRGILEAALKKLESIENENLEVAKEQYNVDGDGPLGASPGTFKTDERADTRPWKKGKEDPVYNVNEFGDRINPNPVGM